jgi:mono/diheme cytochrome c family protein
MCRILDVSRPHSRAFIFALALAFVFDLPAIADCRDKSGDWKAGSGIYHNTCITCHGEDGHGTRRGMPDLTTGVMAYSSSSLTEHIRHGFQTRRRPLAMPPKGGNPDLTDEDIRNVLSYLHHAFGCG